MPEHLFVMHDFHAPPAEYEGRTDHERILDSACDLDRLLKRAGHAAFRHRYSQLIHLLIESVPILCQVNCLRRCTNNLHASILKLRGNVERSLPAKLTDHPIRLLLFVYAEHILDRQPLEVELVGRVEIR